MKLKSDIKIKNMNKKEKEGKKTPEKYLRWIYGKVIYRRNCSIRFIDFSVIMMNKGCHPNIRQNRWILLLSLINVKSISKLEHFKNIIVEGFIEVLQIIMWVKKLKIMGENVAKI